MKRKISRALSIGLTVFLVACGGKTSGGNSVTDSHKDTLPESRSESVDSTDNMSESIDSDDMLDTRSEIVDSTDMTDTMSEIVDSTDTKDTISEADENIGLDEEILEALLFDSPSCIFAGGIVFDFVRMEHDYYENAVREVDLNALQEFYYLTYNLFLEDPDSVSQLPGLIDPEKNDTDVFEWNIDVIPLEGDDVASLCYMPVESDLHEARIFGIALGSKDDGYYFAMIDKDENKVAEVYRNNPLEGMKKVGEVQGRGFELMENFTRVIKEDYYSESSQI